MTWGFPSYRRNAQPSSPGKTARVGGPTPTGSYGEIDYLRNANEQATARAGSLYMHWRRYSFDWNDGECSRCRYEITGDSVDPRCPICFGVGWQFGYSRPSIQWMIIKDARTVMQIADTGWLRVKDADSFSPAIPRISPLDVVAAIQYRNGVWRTGDRFEIDVGVDEVRARDQLDSLRHGTDDHLDFEPEVIAYTFTSHRIPRDFAPDSLDIRYSLPTENPVWIAHPEEAISLP